MDRRDFIVKGALAGAAGAVAGTTSSCILLPRLLASSAGSIWFPDMDGYLGLMDTGLDHIENGGLAAGVAKQGIDISDHEDLAKKALRTLFLTGMFGDLPIEGQTHPGMQDRMWSAMPEYDHSVFGIMGYLEGLPAGHKAEISARLAHRSSPIMRIAEEIDCQAAQCGVSEDRRLQTRSMMSHMALRLAHQPPDLFFDEVLEKCRKIAQRSTSNEEIEKAMAARLGEDVFLALRARSEEMARAWQERCGSSKPKGTKKIVAGAVVLGLGAFITAAAAILVAAGANIVGWFLFTPGGILLLAGLITIIVGASIKSSGKP